MMNLFVMENKSCIGYHSLHDVNAESECANYFVATWFPFILVLKIYLSLLFL